MSAKDEIKQVVKEGIRQGQAEVGAPLPPLTKKDREEAGRNIVAAFFVSLWRRFFG